MTRLARRKSESPLMRVTSAYSPSEGRNINAKSVVAGGRIYFLAMDSACSFTARSKFFLARSSFSLSPRSEATNLGAVLSTLQTGFRTAAIERRSGELKAMLDVAALRGFNQPFEFFHGEFAVDGKIHPLSVARGEKYVSDSFTRISERLERMYESVGEMKSLSGNVADIKRVFTNVKLERSEAQCRRGRVRERR